jgi:hypothetical protein
MKTAVNVQCMNHSRNGNEKKLKFCDPVEDEVPQKVDPRRKTERYVENFILVFTAVDKSTFTIRSLYSATLSTVSTTTCLFDRIDNRVNGFTLFSANILSPAA